MLTKAELALLRKLRQKYSPERIREALQIDAGMRKLLNKVKEG